MNMLSECASEARRSDGSIDIEVLGKILGVTKADLAASIGLSAERDALESGQESREAQHRLNVLVDLLQRVTPWAGDSRAAFDWYCSQAIAGFGGKTAQDLLKEGRASVVVDYLDRIAKGGYA